VSEFDNRSPEDVGYGLDLPYHLAKASREEAAMADELCELLTEFEFIEYKVSGLAPQPLIDDYDLALQPDIEISEEIKDNLKLIQSAIRMSANVLANDPNQLPSQLLGHLMPYRSVDESEFDSKSWSQILLIKVINYWKQPPEFVETLMLFARELTFNILTRPLQFIDEKLPSRFSLYPFLYWWYKFVEVATNWIVKLIFIYPCVAYQVSDLMKKRYLKPKPPYFVTIDVLLEQVKKSKDRPWLRPLAPSLTPAGEILIRTLSLEGNDFLSQGIIAITPDGTKMVSGSKSLIVWDMKTGTRLKTLTGHTDSVIALAITPDGKQIVSGSGSRDSTIKIWNIETGENIDTFIGHQSSIRAIAITPDGKNIVSASSDTTVKVWDLQTGECLCTCIEHKKSVSVLAIHPDRDKVISGDDDKRLILWNLKNGQLLREIKTFEGYLYAIAITNYGFSFTGDEKKILVATRVRERDNPFEVCDISTGNVLKNLTDETWLGTYITHVAITPDETKVVAVSEDRNQIKILNLRTGIPLGAFEAHYGQYVTALAITPDGKQVVTGAHKTIKIWDLTLIQKKSKIKSITKHNSSVQTVAITPDGKQAISGDGNGTIIIWDIDSQKPLETLAEGYNGIKSIAVTPDGQKFVSTFVSLEGSYKGVQIWNFHNTKKLFGNRRAEREVETVAITPDSRYIVSGVYNSIIIWDLDSPNIFRELYDPAFKPITSVVITPDGKYIIAGTVENLLFVWDFKSGHLINVIELLNKWNVRDSSESVISLAVSPNSKQLISASTDGSMRLWDIAKGTELKNFSIHSSSVNSVVVTPSGKFAISADDTLKVWHLQTGKIVANFSVESSVLSCAVTSDGLTIVAGELSGRVHFLSWEGMEKFKERTPDSAL